MPNNNAAERAVRCVAVGRRNWTFAGSDAGGHRAAAAYTLMETCKLTMLIPRRGLLTCSHDCPITPQTASPNCCRGTGKPRASQSRPDRLQSRGPARLRRRSDEYVPKSAAIGTRLSARIRLRRQENMPRGKFVCRRNAKISKLEQWLQCFEYAAYACLVSAMAREAIRTAIACRVIWTLLECFHCRVIPILRMNDRRLPSRGVRWT